MNPSYEKFQIVFFCSCDSVFLTKETFLSRQGWTRWPSDRLKLNASKMVNFVGISQGHNVLTLSIGFVVFNIPDSTILSWFST